MYIAVTDAFPKSAKLDRGGWRGGGCECEYRCRDGPWCKKGGYGVRGEECFWLNWGGGLGSWTRSYSMALLWRREEKENDGSVAALVVVVRISGMGGGVLELWFFFLLRKLRYLLVIILTVDQQLANSTGNIEALASGLDAHIIFVRSGMGRFLFRES